MSNWQVRNAVERTASLKIPFTFIKQPVVQFGAEFKVVNAKIRCFIPNG